MVHRYGSKWDRCGKILVYQLVFIFWQFIWAYRFTITANPWSYWFATADKSKRDGCGKIPVATCIVIVNVWCYYFCIRQTLLTLIRNTYFLSQLLSLQNLNLHQPSLILLLLIHHLRWQIKTKWTWYDAYSRHALRLWYITFVFHKRISLWYYTFLSQPTFERTDSQPQSTFEPTDLLASASIESSKLSFNEVRESVMLLFG